MTPATESTCASKARFDIIYRGDECPIIEHHFCREWDGSVGCYGTNPDHGFTLDEACEMVAQWHRDQDDLWRSKRHPQIAELLGIPQQLDEPETDVRMSATRFVEKHRDMLKRLADE